MSHGVRQLAFTADDFGASSRVNDAVARAAREGMLTGASWMAGGAAADPALRLATELPLLAVGVHLTCVLGRSVLPASVVPALVDAGGHFPASPVVQGLRLVSSRVARAQLRAELRAQVERCLAGGIVPRHLDAHLDFQVHPVVFPIIAALAKEYGIPAVRLPRDPLVPALAFDRRHTLRKCTEAVVFLLLCRRAARIAAAHRLRFAARVYGHHQTGALDERYVLAVVRDLPDGVSELYCHPGAASGPDPELAALLSPHVRAACDARSIRTCHYDVASG
ncbi:MAG TPA: ChbG/HpnK family deacetylase [Candidatus Binatia bacterium]